MGMVLRSLIERRAGVSKRKLQPAACVVIEAVIDSFLFWDIQGAERKKRKQEKKKKKEKRTEKKNPASGTS
jgi:hypothetical protein